MNDQISAILDNIWIGDDAPKCLFFLCYAIISAFQNTPPYSGHMLLAQWTLPI